MFRRPTDDSSSSESEDEEPSKDVYNRSSRDTEEIHGTELTTTETLSSGESVSIDDSRDESGIKNVEQHRNMMLASLLEDFYRTRAAELLNAASPGSNYHRQSPEVQSLAKSLFDQTSQTLTAGGVLPSSVASEEASSSRRQYLDGFDSLGIQNIQDNDLLSNHLIRRVSGAAQGSTALVRKNVRPSIASPNSMQATLQELALRTGSISLMSHPLNDMQLTTTHSPRSHYQSSFQEVRLLGKGGFGRVYHTYNYFDKRDYAVKKIPLSPRLSQKYREKGHTELSSVLREVQALARLDHCNVVRYHATWIEEPSIINAAPVTHRFPKPHDRRRLLANGPAFAPNHRSGRFSPEVRFDEHSDGIQFEAESTNDIDFVEPSWSIRAESHQDEPSSIVDSDIFTDGLAKSNDLEKSINDPFCYVLHVQMSMYPMTLTQYLAPTRSGTADGDCLKSRRHCFHLVPALRMMLGVLCGLQYIHSNGFIHRDIKPGNIFISSHDFADLIAVPDGFRDVGSCGLCPHQLPYYVNPRIGDFGLVTDLARDTAEPKDGSRSSSDRAVGTEYYRPPRLGKDSAQMSPPVDEKTDVFALGVILVELLCCCSTSMERLDMLKGLQQGQLPVSLSDAFNRGQQTHRCGQLVRDCIRGMIDRDTTKRWTCQKVKERIEMILKEDHLNDFQSETSNKLVSLDGTG
jgi:translation initiation factor 2-alpha kinase 3